MSHETPMGPMSWVNTPRDLEHLLEAIREAELVVMDLETTGLEEHATRGGQMNGGVAARIVLSSFTVVLPGQNEENEPTTYIVPGSHPDSPWLGQWRKVHRRITATMVEYRVPLSNQNVKFDARWINATTAMDAFSGIDLSEIIVWDTQISSHLLDENASTRLKERAPATFNVPRWDDFDLTYPGAAEEAPLFGLGEYAARDTYWTWRLMLAHQRQMFLADWSQDEPQDASEVIDARLGLVATWVAMPTTASLTRMEQRGILLDQEWVSERLATLEAEIETATNWMLDLHYIEGKVSTAANSNWFLSWTREAIEEGGLRVGALTPTGQPQWGKDVLIRQARAGSEQAQAILDHRRATKLSQFLRSWQEKVAPDGAIHASYRAGSVVTGRLASASPNMQQVTKELRPAFIPRPGYVIADIDFSQIELRVAAFLSRSQPMLEAFQRGNDLHRLLAAQIVSQRNRKENERLQVVGKPPALAEHVRPEDVTDEERQAGKSANFGLLYMMGANGFREYAESVYDVVLTDEEAAAVHQAFFDTWTGMSDWHSRQVKRAYATGQVVSPIGRVRRLPDIFSGNDRMRKHAERNAVNSPVQGFASDLMQIAAASIQGLLPGASAVPGVHLVATVHDSIVVEVPEDDWQNLVDQCRWRMTEGILPVLRKMDCELDVPLVADATVGTRWGLGDV